RRSRGRRPTRRASPGPGRRRRGTTSCSGTPCSPPRRSRSARGARRGSRRRRRRRRDGRSRPTRRPRAPGSCRRRCGGRSGTTRTTTPCAGGVGSGTSRTTRGWRMASITAALMGSSSCGVAYTPCDEPVNPPPRLDAGGTARPPSPMLFEQLRAGGCLSYVAGCEKTCAGVIVDPALDLIDRYVALTVEKGLRVRYVIDSHTHADHFSAARDLARQLGARIVMHRRSAAPFADLRVDDGELLVVGDLRLRVLHTPGHTDDSMCLVLPDRVLTGDTLLIGATGRTDLPSGDPEALHESLFGKLLALDDGLLVFPAHDYKGRDSSTLGAEKASNPRLQKKERAAFVELMRGLDLAMPEHLTEALRTNRTGGKTVKQLIAEAAREVPFMGM